MNTLWTYLDRSIEMIDTIFFDLDGTLLDSKKEISQQCLELLKIYNDKHIFHFGIATGRNFGSVKPLVKRYKLEDVFDVIIANNGADVYLLPGMDCWKFGYLTDKQVNSIIQTFYQHPDITVAFHNSNILYATQSTTMMQNICKANGEHSIISPLKHTDYENPPRIMLEFHDIETLKYIKSHTIKGVKGYWSEPNIYEFITVQVSKTNAIQFYMKKKRLSLSNVMVFGDGDNDVEMLRRVRIGIAMKNATAKTIQASDYILKKVMMKMVFIIF